MRRLLSFRARQACACTHNRMNQLPDSNWPGARFLAAVRSEKPLQVVGAINAYTARLAESVGFKAI